LAKESELMSSKHTVPVAPAAYEIQNSPLPFSRSSWHRWEKAGLIPPMLRIGGKTLIPASTIAGILDGAIKLPKNAGMLKAPQPHSRRRKRAKAEPETTPAHVAE
jgi:hypothetical protein